MKQKKQWGEDVYPLISWFRADKVKKAKVLVAGAGALGNEVLKNLALFGVGNIVIVDFDQIEYSNLTRSILFRETDADKGYSKAEVAAKRIKEINPSINVQAICGNLATDVGLGLYRQMDVVIGCLDSLMARLLLNRLSFRAGVPWIDGGIGDLEGEVSAYQIGSSCYECSLTEEEEKELETRMSCAGITRDNESFGRIATTPVIASIIAAIQVQEAMKIIHKEEGTEEVFTPLLGKIFHYEGMHPYAEVFDFKMHRDTCPSHECWRNIVEIPELSADMTVKEALTIIKKALNANQVEINMRNEKFVDKLISRSNNQKFLPMLPESKIPAYIEASEELRTMAFTEGGLYQNAFENIDDEFPYPELRLREIGIPYWDVLQVVADKSYAYVELTADRNRFKELFSS
ncbi:MAG: ThiF family adenylyltransferase [Dysgonomonas sp.]